MMKKNYLLTTFLAFFIFVNQSNGQIENTLFGQDTGLNNTGNYNNGFGKSALVNNTGASNSAFGIGTLSVSSGSFNCAFGNDALNLNRFGSLNCAFGTRSLENNLFGSNNIAIGHRSMGNPSEPGSNNTAIGYATLLDNKGNNNVAIGYFTPRHLQSGDSNIFVGATTGLYLENGSNNLFLGRVAVNNDVTTPIVTGKTTNGTIILADGLGNQRLFVSQKGNLGIGLGNNIIPRNRLDVNGGIVVGKNYMSKSYPIQVQGALAPANGLLVEGNVGIGNTNPNSKVEITQGQNGNSGLRFTNLTSAFNPTTLDATNKFLSVDGDGDVVLQYMPNLVATNALTSLANTMTSNVNGISSNAPIVNSISNVFNSNNQLITTVNGVISSPVTIPIPTFTEVDGSTTNELQTLSQAGNTITLSNGGGSFNLPTFVDNDEQTLALTGNNLSISNGNTVVLPTFVEVDGSTTNELQTLSQAGNTITLSNGGGSFNLPTFVDNDEQTLALTGNNLSISNGNTVVLPTFVEVDGSTTNELQTLSQTGNTITLSNGGGSFNLPTFVDAQSLTITGNTISISNGNSIVIPTTNVVGGTNTTVTGNGSTATPFVVNSVDTSLYASNGSINQATTTNGNRVVNMNSSNIWFDTSTSTANGNIYIGSSTAYPNTTGNYKLFVEGGILTEKVKVALRSTANWADYVFDTKYKLMPLKEVEQFIISNKHLPGVESANELSKNGLDLAQMQAKQMEKIEELTLYAIDQNKKIEQQSIEIENNKKELEVLKAQMKVLIEKTK
ncbi:hypothetical protein OX283_007290 [Flavobacterium sp. SUN052]|uniref:beta strand repeat-containing protein n=1 Tax=Flavobacterium sp. SUN052 TaxID=3002441 RepID=UPI00237D3AC1|nr:hypothetical protein [Flavobacterium sp. SUN052]MEC4004455.1 hypothetical protein [Flavobacterium sp. SUN052]